MKKEWEPKTSDCFLVTGGQLKRLRDEPDQEKRTILLYPMINQRYHSDIEKEGKRLDDEKYQKRIISDDSGPANRTSISKSKRP